MRICFCILITLISCVKNVSAQETDSIVTYREVDWSMFKGSPNNDSLGAQISTMIHLQVDKRNRWNGRITFESFAIMNTLRSWVRPDYRTAYALRHEQTHFNITEMCARRFMAELNAMKIRTDNSAKIRQTFAKWQKIMEDTQDLYDSETRGPDGDKKQKEWNEKVDKELANLKR